MSTIEEQVEEFEAIRPLYEKFAQKLKDLMVDLSNDSSVPVHMIESRAKSVDSFREKMARPGKSYKNGLKELPDLCGLRIITYYQADCDQIAKIIKDEFNILETELSHQPDKLQVDTFGYISAHYVVSLKRGRYSLAEWKRFEKLRVEIQVRTVIQHAWSAVSHAIQYKAESEIPSKLQRRLYRIAGLFELADEEFEAIRNERASLRESVSAALAAGNKEVALSVASLQEFINQWEHINKIEIAAKSAGFEFSNEDYTDSDSIGDILDLATRAGIKNIRDLEATLNKSKTSIFKNVFSGQSKPSKWIANISFLVNLMLISSCIDHVTVDYLRGRGWGKDISNDIMASINQ